MVGEIARGQEEPLARGTIVVHLGLSVMLMQAESVLKESTACSAIVVVGLVVIFELLDIVKVRVAVLAIIVHRTLHKVLFQPPPRSKVLVTIIANMMVRRILLVLAKS
jgi:hypothetical protein